MCIACRVVGRIRGRGFAGKLGPPSSASHGIKRGIPASDGVLQTWCTA